MLPWSLRPLGSVLQCPGIGPKSVQPSDFGGKLKESGEGRVYTRTLLHLNLREIVQHFSWMLPGRPFTLTLSLRIVLTRGNCQGSNETADFFVSKIDTIRSNIDASSLSCSKETVPEDFEIGPQKVLSSFKPLTEATICKLIQSSAKKSCALDPMPTPLVVSCLDVLLPVIATIVNSSLLTGRKQLWLLFWRILVWHLSSPTLDPLVTYILSQNWLSAPSLTSYKLTCWTTLYIPYYNLPTENRTVLRQN